MLKSDDLRSPVVVITDSGLAQCFAASRGGVCGTPGYIPPETWHTGRWYPKGDCFSLGVVALQMLIDSSEGVFTAGASCFEDIRSITCSREPPLQMIPPQHQDLVELIRQLLAKDPSARITAADASEGQWLNVEQSPNPRLRSWPKRT